MKRKIEKSQIIAGAVTLVAALLLLLALFFGGMGWDKSELASDSVPEEPDEELFIEPEMLEVNAGDPDEDSRTAVEPEPKPAGEPEKADEPKDELVPETESVKPSKSTEKLVTQKKPSPVKAQEPEKKKDKEPSRISSKMGGKFSSKNGDGGKQGANGSGGAGEGVNGKLRGRSFISCSLPKVRLRSKLVVVVSVEVDDAGKVVSAAISSSGGASAEIQNKCVASARTARWSAKEGAPLARGSLTFTLVPKI